MFCKCILPFSTNQHHNFCKLHKIGEKVKRYNEPRRKKEEKSKNLTTPVAVSESCRVQELERLSEPSLKDIAIPIVAVEFKEV